MRRSSSVSTMPYMGMARMFSVDGELIYDIEKFRCDFSDLNNGLKVMAAEIQGQGDQRIEKEQLRMIICSAMIYNFQRYQATEKHNRSARRDVLKKGDLREYEKYIGIQHEIMTEGFVKDLELITKIAGVSNDRLMESSKHIGQSDPTFQQEIHQFWLSLPGISPEPPAVNRLGLLDDQLIHLFKYMTDVCKSFKDEQFSAGMPDILKPLYINDKVFIKLGYEPEDIVLMPETTSEAVKIAYGEFTATMHRR